MVTLPVGLLQNDANSPEFTGEYVEIYFPRALR